MYLEKKSRCVSCPPNTHSSFPSSLECPKFSLCIHSILPAPLTKQPKRFRESRCHAKLLGSPILLWVILFLLSSSLNPYRDKDFIPVFEFFLIQLRRTSWYPGSPWVSHHLSPKPFRSWVRSQKSGVGNAALSLCCCVTPASPSLNLRCSLWEKSGLDMMVLSHTAVA